MPTSPPIEDAIVARARELGFDHVALLPVDPLPEREAFTQWLAEARHGEMGFMDKFLRLRLDPAELEPGSLAVVCVLKSYKRPDDLTPAGLRIARYAHGDDYHDILRARLRQLAAFIHSETGRPVGERPATDPPPLAERELARSAGLGWIGKNSMLIHPRIGSFTFIAELLVALDLAPTNLPPTPDRCGTCTRCLDACPTGAISSPYLIDARRCISYLTIEHRGPIPRHLRPLLGDYLFGCDLCQDVCPWNTRAPNTRDPAFAQRPILEVLTPEMLLCLDQSSWSVTFRRTAIKRTKRRGLLRNAAVVLGNRADPASAPLLGMRLEVEPEPLVRGHIAWALGRIQTPSALRALRDASRREREPFVVEEIHHALLMAARDHEDAPIDLLLAPD